MRPSLGLIVGLIALLILSACGQAGQPASADPKSSASTTPETASVSAAASGETTADHQTPEPKLPAIVTDNDGNQVTVRDVSRIIPLNGDIAEIVWTLGLGANIVATDSSATYPTEFEQLPKIGYQRQLSAEGIIALNPTVIIGNEDAGPPEVLEQLRVTGIPVVIVSDPPTLDAPTLKIKAVADALGISERGAELATQVQTEIDAAKELAAKATSHPSVLFLYVRGTKTQMIGGTGTSADAMIAAAGGIDAGTAAGIEEYKPMTAEALAAARPDVLLLLSAGLESVGGVDGLLQIPGVAQTPAGENRRILAYDDLYLLGMGPRTGQALRELTTGLHPELE